MSYILQYMLLGTGVLYVASFIWLVVQGKPTRRIVLKEQVFLLWLLCGKIWLAWWACAWVMLIAAVIPYTSTYFSNTSEGLMTRFVMDGMPYFLISVMLIGGVYFYVKWVSYKIWPLTKEEVELKNRSIKEIRLMMSKWPIIGKLVSKK